MHTSLPGVVVSYDAATRRARVQPAVDHLVSPEGNPNAEFGDLEPMPNPIILDVPVMLLHPAAATSCIYRWYCPGDTCIATIARNGILQRSNRLCAPVRRRPMMLWKSSTPFAIALVCVPQSKATL